MPLTRTVPSWGELGLLQQARSRLPEELQPPPLLRRGGFTLACESLQVTGSYKVRAVCHLLEELRGALPPGGLALASSGNFAVALAWAGQRYGVPVTAVMMRRSHPWKVARVQAYGGRIVFCGDSTDERTEALKRLAGEACVVDHLVDPRVLVGHATLGLDLAPAQARAVVVPASTGGLLASVALACKQLDPGVRVVGVQPEAANAMVSSFRAGEMRRLDSVTTECDALTANRPGDLPLQLALEWVDDMVTVSEAEIRTAVRWLAEEAKLVVEPGGAAAVAACLNGSVPREPGSCAVVSGGNMAPERLAEWLRAGA